MAGSHASTPNQELLERNLRLFVWFRAFFNARFYYPVFAVFFTDLGLTMAQFLWLNAIWALTIVIFEVPSGVLADLVGRRKLVIFSALSMAVEMLLLIVAPQHGGWGLFAICAVNRVLSGLAEAAASGADEALAYDSLKLLTDDAGKIEHRWDDTLVAVMRWRSLGGVLAMLVGGFVFDHEGMIAIFGDFPRTISLKLPVILCFVSACVCVLLAFRLTDLGISKKQAGQRTSVVDVGRGMLAAAGWVLKTKWIAALIVAAVLIDAITRTFVTLQSEYFRWIELPEYSFGIIGAGMSLAGVVVPFYVKPLVRKFAPRVNMLIAGGIGVAGLAGVSWLQNGGGIAATFVIMLTLIHVGFLMSRYINRDTPSEQRASILSVNNLTLNIGYGLFSGVFALRLNHVDFGEAIKMLPLVLLVGIGLWFVASRGARKSAQQQGADA
ncbi:MFS transporter [Verrucomicrobiaceae bacterium 5K15]|uniref:MFS transporter n=1 Tax=Oceaniferula flava TaxID=2800421 RepID=A0AAE2VBL8_9BACT|nr:MFS transporter [Oceaniferula flavus]MBK1853946.1 MFS transporter [Oceaniferula flavus]MBM1135252.1 MFS transporter [Oceaniferula flavus]